MFSNIFKKKEKEGGVPRSGFASRPFGKRTAGTGSIDATLSALALGGPPEKDPFAASPPTSAALPPPLSASQRSPQSATESAMDGYSSMFNPLKAASRYPGQPLFGPEDSPQ